MNNSSAYRRPGAFSPHPLNSPGLSPGHAQNIEPSESDSSSSSQVTALSLNKRPPHPQQLQAGRRPLIPSGSSNTSSTSVNTTLSRPSINHANTEQPLRRNSPFLSDPQKHKRQHSQGFFEPSLPTASLAEQATMTNLTASQIAAQAAMQHQAANQQNRNRSQTAPVPQSPPEAAVGRRKPPPPLSVADIPRRPGEFELAKPQHYQNGLVGGHSAAATAANAAFPRSAPLSPGLTRFDPPFDKQNTIKTERSKIKLFSKPKQLGTSASKDMAHQERTLPSPISMGPPGPSGLSRMVNPSMTSLADSMASGPSYFYNTNNNSTSTLVPVDRQVPQEKEKPHKHHFLSRQKNKLKEKIGDDHTISLSSASIGSKALDQNATQALYSLAPPSPGPSMNSFSKSVSGLDLRHGGRALRERKKEEKASTAHQAIDSKRLDVERTDRALSTSVPSSTTPTILGSLPPSNVSIFGGLSNFNAGDALASQAGLQGFGLTNMSPEDAWDFLKAKLLIIFEGEELRIPVEDLNRLVTVHIQHCILKKIPTAITQDLRDLLRTGFQSLNQTLKGIPDHRLVPALVDVWLFMFGTILPYMQAVFLPLDVELKDHGNPMTPREAADFWGASPGSIDNGFGNEFDVRHMVLLSFRDNVVLPHHDSLKATFSRLSLESINASVNLVSSSPDPGTTPRPGTAGSLDPGMASFNSQGSTLLGDGSRSRAASNLSAPELPPFAPSRLPRHAPANSSQVTETVGRMLQCVSVLGSVQSGDDAQMKMEGLAKELKLNWLGRGRTGRNRKGFVGARVGHIRHGSSPGDMEGSERNQRSSML